MQGNKILKARMTELGFTQSELAETVNADLRAAGYEGTVSDRTVRNWLTGKSRWPHLRQRAALEAVFDCPVTELGFAPRGDVSPRRAPPEDPVQRRRFVSATAGALMGTAANTPAHGAQPRVGSGDVQRLLSKFAVVVASDHRYGGKLTIETQASALAGEAIALQARGTASQRVRGALYGCAASFTSSAMWAAIDGRRFDTAQRHFERAASLASMSGDSTIQFRIWSHAGSMYRHMARPADALATNDVARRLPIARRDPLFASLGHARHAAILGLTGDTRAVRQALGHAEDALQQAEPGTRRPVWMTAFYDRAELENLALAAHLALGDYEGAEAYAHRSLALLRPEMQRTRAITTARLAHAQLGQGDLEPAVTTAMAIPFDPVGQHPRVEGMLQSFGEALHLIAPSSPHTRGWDAYARDSKRHLL
ncbi:helix-turn-helix transcriptional regulator [Streptomyces iconiensis]|uniref:Helix-turn-helix transcriptional regulator n=1 Tax=Streptomyces iconiensis TaxID=1384038 RepID=A0ABT7AA35_9ACTN|nr:helix-turn-helix transcriptional regulator [Streptomyces iconiensis]MDJ1138160.1 helix-turn-helix transcriptional regulator [Streptomyces iconiensis]